MLLDTHVFLWLPAVPKRLSSKTLGILADPENDVYISAAVGWEIGIKSSLGKIALPEDSKTYVIGAMRRLGFAELPISIAHAHEAATLPRLHHDPFDRIMIAQASVEALTLVTADPQILRYPVQTLDARASS